MKKLLFLLIISTSAFAQNFKIDSTIINGKKYWVYPYKFEWDKGEIYDDLPVYSGNIFERWKQKRINKMYLQNNHGNLSNTEIPPVLDSLPSGDFVVYYALHPNTSWWAKTFKTYEYHIGAIFHVEEGVMNGKISYYTYEDKKVSEEGFMKNALKDGEWRMKGNYDYYSGLWVKNYVEGNENGLQQFFWLDENGSLRLSMEYMSRNDSAYKMYKTYHWNGNLQFETHCDSIIILTRDYFHYSEFYSFMPDSVINNYFKYLSLKKKKDKEKFSYCYYDYFDGKWRNPHNMNSSPAHAPYTVYHQNGTLFGNFKYEALEKKKEMYEYNYDENKINYRYELIFDTLYHPNGTPAIIRKKLSDSLGQRRFVISGYNSEQKLFRRDYYVLDSNNIFVPYQKQVLTWKGELITDLLDYSSFYKKDSVLFSGDTLILQAVKYDYHGKEKQYIASHIPDKVFSNYRSIFPHRKVDFKILKNDTIYQYYYHIDYGDVDVYSYYSNDTTTASGAFRLGDFNSHYLLFADGEEADSIKVFYKDNPFSGSLKIVGFNSKKMPKEKLFINEEGDSTYVRDCFTIKDNDITFFTNEYYDSYDYSCSFEYTLNNGNITSFKELNFKNQVRLELTFKDHLTHGMAREYLYKKTFLGHKKMLKGQTYWEKGLKEGYAYEWINQEKSGDYIMIDDGEGQMVERYIPGTQYPNDPKYYLTSKRLYFKDTPIDSVINYFPNGEISRFWVKDSLGTPIGQEIEYFRGGKINTYRQYSNGVMDSVFYRLNDKGDTLDFASWKEGKLEGRANHYSYNYETGALDKKSHHYYSNDAPAGTWVTYDGFGTKRIELTIDTAYGTKSYTDDLSSVNEYMSSDVAAAFKVYHSNGVLYCEGKTAVRREKRLYGIDSVYVMYKVGKWTYRNNVGRIISEVNYHKEFRKMLDNDSLSYIGDYKEYYGDGKLKYEGKLISEDARLDCGSDINELAFYVDYKTYLNERGEALVKNGSGKLTTFYGDGSKWTEGTLVNGKEEGWWKSYSKEGVLNEVGQYKNGKKDGRWLSGDLTGINYIDDKCFENEEEKQKEQEAAKNRIQLEMVIWKEGVIASRNYFYFVRSQE